MIMPVRIIHAIQPSDKITVQYRVEASMESQSRPKPRSRPGRFIEVKVNAFEAEIEAATLVQYTTLVNYLRQ